MKKQILPPEWQPIFPPAPFRKADWVLPAMILVGVFIHGIAFYLIQSSAPTTKSLASAHPGLSILNADRPTDAAFLRWIENHDPAAIAGNDAAPQPPASLLQVPYQPSYEQLLPEPLAIPPEEKPGSRLTFFPPGPVPESAFLTKPAPVPFPELSTQVITSAALVLSEPKKMAPPLPQKKLALPTRIFVSASASTERRFFFIMDSSGDEPLDAYAKTWLADSRTRFLGGAKMGWATFYWGAEP